jgi:hypothetical protein
MPTTYSADDLKQLADTLDTFASNLPVGNPGKEGLEASSWAQSMGSLASNLRLIAVKAYLAEAAEPMEAILQATREAQETVATLKKFSKTIELVGDVMLLGSIIWLQKWNLVGPTLKELRKDIVAR